MLKVEDLKVGYGKKMVVNGINIHVGESEIVSLLGHNGAGKTTSLYGLFGLLKPHGGQILYNGNKITGRLPMDNVRDGIALVPQERFLFPGFSVRENLEVAGYSVKNKDHMARNIEMVHELFPILKQRGQQIATTLSGGERRMLGVGMALVTSPKLLILDEPSIGLSPLIVEKLMGTLQYIQESLGASILVVEQNIKQVLQISHRAYVMKLGCVILEEEGKKLLDRGEWWDLY